MAGGMKAGMTKVQDGQRFGREGEGKDGGRRTGLKGFKRAIDHHLRWRGE